MTIAGVGIDEGFTDRNIIQGNYIGVGAGGRGDDVEPGGIGNDTGVFLLGPALVGGLTPAAGNLIANSRLAGVHVVYHARDFGKEEGPPQSLIQGNFIVPDVELDRGESNAGVAVSGNGHLVGGLEPGAGNIISGNGTGILILARSTRILGNAIGTDLEGLRRLGNDEHGIEINPVEGFSNIEIGGTEAGSGNQIAYNLAAGIAITRGEEFTEGMSLLPNCQASRLQSDL